MEKIHLAVNGIANSQSKTSLKNALEKIDGIHAVNIDMGESSVEVEYNAPATETGIRSCIENTGFTVR